MFPEVEAQFASYVDIQDSDIELKESLNNILAWAENYIFSLYGVSIIEREQTENLDGSGSNKLYVSYGNISSITSLVVSESAVDTTLFKLNKNMIYDPTNLFTKGTFNVSITYKVGYTTYNLIPPSLLNALFVVGRKMFTDSTKNPDNLAMISSDIKQSIKFIDSIPLLADNILQAYRIFRL